MNIFIPLNGIGVRFQQHGYTDIKPFIKLHGVPLICSVLKGIDTEEHDVYIIARNSFKKQQFDQLINHYYPRVKVLYLEKDTQGAADTLLQGLYLSGINNNESFLSIDGDTIYREEVVCKIKDFNTSTIFYFETEETHPIYSYINIDSNNNVTDIQEKQKISNLANTGAYFFHSIKTFKKIVEQLLQINCNTEIYTSCVYKKMINDGYTINSIKIKDFDVIGTPLQLQNYCYNNNYAPLRFVFDLDNTLVTSPKIKNDYSSVSPLQENINFLNNLKNQGHYIIIYTARRMRTHYGNVSKVVADVGKITIETLEKFKIQYDEICFGKPYAHYYIDDLSVNPLKENLQYSTGFYFSEKTETRPFNKIVITDNKVIKTGNVSGEAYWYKNCPNIILDKYFPTIDYLDNNTIHMEKIKGLSLSYLYTNNLLSELIVDKILNCVNEIHNTVPTCLGDYNKNYTIKITERYNDNKVLYDQLRDSQAKCIEILNFFENYSCNTGTIIHGDPVFSNTFLTCNSEIKFIDVRGKNGSEYSLYGDVLYDYAKIYQSILGYDFILHGESINTSTVNRFKPVFEKKILNIFKSEYNLYCIKQITKSLIFSMLPLHSDISKIKQYYRLLENI